MRLYFTVAEFYSTVASKFYFKLPQMVGRRIQFTLVLNTSKDHLVLSKTPIWNGEFVHKKSALTEPPFTLLDLTYILPWNCTIAANYTKTASSGLLFLSSC